MNSLSPTKCLVCRKHRGETALPGGAIYEDELIFISHAPLRGDEKDHYLGHVFIEPKRHVPELAGLSEAEDRAIGLHTSRVAKALMRTERIELVTLL